MESVLKNQTARSLPRFFIASSGIFSVHATETQAVNPAFSSHAAECARLSIKVIGSIGDATKAVPKVKRLCLLIQRMDKQGADADMPGRCLLLIGATQRADWRRKRFVLDASLAKFSNGLAVRKASTDADFSKISSFSRGESENKHSGGLKQTAANLPAACSSAASGAFSADWEARLMEAVTGSEERERAERFILKHKPVVGSMIKAGLIGIRKLLELGAPECVVDGLANEVNTSPEEWAEWGQTKETIKKVKELHAARPKAPYLDDQGRLRIPCDCEPKYHWWQDGQSPFETALELGASDEELEHHVNEIFNPDDWRKWQEIKAKRRAEAVFAKS